MMEESSIVSTPRAVVSEDLLNEVFHGLSQKQKCLPAKLLYDKRGSELFEKICLLKEYYPTRAETEILKTYSGDIARLIGPRVHIIEPGSGAGDKIRYLLPYLVEPKGYYPIEISKEILARMTLELAQEFPLLNVAPFCADFTQMTELPLSLNLRDEKNVIFFPGSTVGNFHPQVAIDLLNKFGNFLGPHSGLLIGVDLKKDPGLFHLAYDDPHGVTAAFNMNVLERLNRELDSHFNLNHFSHSVVYNDRLGRVEMHLMSEVNQTISVYDRQFMFYEGETIHTENSYKYAVEEFIELCALAKFKIKKFWKDSQNLFCVYYFERD